MYKNNNSLFRIYSINQGLHWFALGILIPVMILALLDFGFNIGEIGISMAAMGVTTLLLELPTGGLADTIGRKKIYMISVVVDIVAYSLLLFADKFMILLVVMVLKGAGRALSSGSMDAWFIDGYKSLGGNDEGLQKALARAGIIIPAALGAGTLIGGIIPDLSSTFRVNIVILIILYIFQLFLTAILVKEDKNNFSGQMLEGFREFPKVISSAVEYGVKQRNVLAILIATAALGLGLAGLEQLWQPRITEISPHTGTWVLGLVSAGYFLSASLGSGISTILLKIFRHRYRLLLFVFRFLMAVIYIALALVFNLLGFIPLYLLLFLFHGVTGSPEMTVFNRDIPAARRSSLLSLNSLFLQAGGALGSVTAGQIAYRLNISAAWIISGFILALSAFAYLMIREKVYENKI